MKKTLVKRALVTAGPTYEMLDPVRFIGNFSSGKMGIAIAEALANQNIEVDLVLGPTHLTTKHPKVTIHSVVSAQDMLEACERFFPDADVAVFSAAVADYRPAVKAEQKIKKTEKEDTMVLELVKNPDILATLAHSKQQQTVVGFALETENELENAQRKRIKKNADIIVLNSLNEAGAGFMHDTNKVTFIAENIEPLSLPLMLKEQVAKELVKQVLHYHQHNTFFC